MNSTNRQPDMERLRLRAEAACEREREISSERMGKLSADATKKMLHELRVAQIELEMQNDELRRAQVALDRSRERYFDLYDLAPIGYLAITDRGQILEANLTAATLLGVTRSELIEQPLSRFAHKEDADEYYFLQKQLVATGETQTLELRMVRGDGTPFWAQLMATNSSNETRSLEHRVVLNDITVRKQAQFDREVLERKMQDAQRLESLGTLAGGIAHDFNNLLTVILGNSELLRLGLPEHSPLLTNVDFIQESTLCAADLCNQMLAYSGRGRFVVQKLDLGRLVDETAQMLKVSISKKAQLRFALDPHLPPVEADATQIRQVTMNLVINASEAFGDDSGVIRLSTSLVRLDQLRSGAPSSEELANGDYVCLKVSDDGPGMSEKSQSRIFEPFYTTKSTGRGLGLAATLGIVRGHEGAITVESRVGHGTTFSLFFPAKNGASDAPSTRVPVATEWQGQGDVLVVDDEEAVCCVIAAMLSRAGFNSVVAADGRAAVEVYRADPERFKLVLLDMTMPRMGGEETFEELRRLYANVRVVLMSGYDKHDALVRFPGKGIVGFLQKPFSFADLHATLYRILGGETNSAKTLGL